MRDTDDGRLVRTLPPPPPPVAREAYDDAPAETPLAAGDVVPQMVFSPDGSRFVHGVTAPGRPAAPELPVLDEPTSGLDPLVQQR
ncbi:hypothetical protein [Streptomyces europaeiscabiei]|uniref:hypothetical protein n=1 Tax=Streptomyces europaeiscabiei TaxID=146819 RepID=UPI002E11A9F9|nr:hypothetical protein OHB30_24165 [Streptomyces europaeiscabiei]